MTEICPKMGSAIDDKIEKLKVEEFFDSSAKLHQNSNAVLDVSPDEKTAHANIYRDYFTKSYIKKYVDPSTEDKILDFGCGVGRVTSFLAPFVNYIEGVDLSSQMIDVANRKNSNHHNINFTWLKQAPLPYPDNNFNKIFTHWVMQHISDSEAIVYFKEFNRTLKKDGMIFLFEQTKNEIAQYSEKHVYRTSEQYCKLIEQAGFSKVAVTPVMRVPSRGMSLWNNKFISFRILLPVHRMIDQFTLERKPQFVNYYTTVFVFKKI